ncbi:MAG TPA: DUF1465 family protein [Beijerinckiaceae bacterium]|nr:DUF1465 family protein [Methylobacteriaceae bacterium]MCC0002567.1 DUF1465 family protein [Methylobacteriaceae bacterium]HRY02545.1 DUF1465 family protein [Beijerinckiaceae bacterium]
MVRLVSSLGQEPVSFVERLAGSDAFKSLFKEGMNLVEEAAAYLDGPGRAEAKALPRMEALAYASESMRLTTRLMQLASWLLLQRAVNEGEMSQTQAASEKHKVKLSNQDMASAPETFHRLPARLRDLVAHSVRLQARIIHLDQLLYARAEALMPPVASSPVADQIERLRMAFAS